MHYTGAHSNAYCSGTAHSDGDLCAPGRPNTNPDSYSHTTNHSYTSAPTRHNPRVHPISNTNACSSTVAHPGAYT
ncbi:MAG: hypothetical protein ACE5IG_03530 [Dehalococcoidia bacterium]